MAERPGHSGVQPTGVRRVWRSARPYVMFMGVWVRGAAPQAVAHLCLIALVLVAQSVLLTARGIDTYTAKIVDANNCTVQETVAVTSLPAPTFNITDELTDCRASAKITFSEPQSAINYIMNTV